MQILKVEIRNINSLSGIHVLDFTAPPMNQAGLFAITGPTGSGKSTLLDAVTLALYGWTPRTGKVTRKEIESSGAVMTRNATDARAAVTYSCASGVYLSEWQIEFNSRGNLREHDMKLYACASDGSNAQITEHLKKSEVPKRNAELIGLDYEQFTRSSLLAQGEFARLLHSDATQRSGLLEKITGTSVYRELGRLAYERGKALNQAIESIDIKIQHEQAQLMGPEALQALQLNHRESAAQIQSLEQEASRLNDAIQAHQRKHAAREDEVRKKEAKEAAELELSQWKMENGSAFEQHLQLEPVADELRRVEGIWARQKTIAENELPTLQSDQTELARLKAQLMEEMSDECVRIEPELEMSLRQEKGAELIKRLAEFVEMAGRLDVEIESIRKNIQRIENKLKSEYPAAPVEEGLDDWWREISQTHALNGLRLEQQQDPLAALEALNPEGIEKALTDWERAEQSRAEALDLLAELRTALEQEEVEESRQSEVEQEASETLQLRKLEALAAEQAWGLKQIRASLEEHRAALKPGEACPLCGALDHPFVVDVPEIPVEQVEVERAQKAAAVAADAHRSARDTHQKLKLNLEHIRNRIAEQEAKREKSLLVIEEARADLPADFTGLKDVSQARRIWQAHLDLLQAKQSWHNADRRHQEIQGELEERSELSENLKDKKETLRRIAPDRVQAFKREVTRWSEAWTSMERDDSVVQSKLQSLGLERLNLEEEMARLEKELGPKVESLGHPSIARACEGLLPSSEFGLLRTARQALDERLNKAMARWEEAHNLWKEMPAPEETMAEMEGRLGRIAEQLGPLKDEASDAFVAIEKEKGLEVSIEELKAQRAEKLRGGEKWHLLAKEIGSATGDKFNRFAQQLTLEHLIHLANARLQRLTHRYRLHLESGSEQLAVLDADLAGVPRSVKTLSGGETFLVSLGLALALSDLASKDVQIHNLFIDEGFGTLDQETLETTLTVLDLLQADDNRCIGIISHVEALKERISTRVQLIPDGRGFSKLSIQG